MKMNSPEISIKDRSVHDIHLEKAFVYVIDSNLKVFAEAINVLSKISEQILLQPFAESLVLTAFNSTKSAYGKVTLSNNFFLRCEAPAEPQVADGDVQCRISTRSALHIFKNVANKSSSILMPSFDTCQLELDPTADFAIVHLQHEHMQMLRAYVLPMKEHQAVCDNIFTEKQRLKNKLTTQPKVLLNLMAGLDCREAKLAFSSTQFTAHRYITRENITKVRKTEVKIPMEHFELYHIHLEAQIVINLKELRSILYFADTCNMAVSLHFDRPGRPLIVAVEDNLEFQAEFVLATLDEPEPAAAHQLNPSQTQTQIRATPVVPKLIQTRLVSQTPPPAQLASDKQFLTRRPQQKENETPHRCSSFC